MDASLIPIARLDALSDDAPAHAEADGIDLVLVRRGSVVHVFEGRCPHQGASTRCGRSRWSPRLHRLRSAVALALLPRVAVSVSP